MLINHKFHAKQTINDGIKFSSKLEARYYEKLKLLQQSGEVIGSFRQIPIHLQGNIKYVMDFLVFYSDGTCEGIEVKGFETKTWLMKQRMLKEAYPWFTLRVVK